MYNTVIIGAGSIGAMKDDKFDYVGGENILTHAHAAYNNPKINLIGIVDINREQRDKAAKKWGAKGYRNIVQVEEKVDIVIVASPTETHYEILEDIIKYQPRLVIAEKPFCDNYTEAKKIEKLYDKMSIPILVNYTRRFDETIKNLQILLNDEHNFLGSIYNCRLLYNRGMKRDGCHFIDFINYFFGEFVLGVVLPSPPIIDYTIAYDPTYAVYMNYTKCPTIVMFPVDGREYSVFEIDIIGQKGRFILSDHGKIIYYQLIEDETTYGDYKALSEKKIKFNTGLSSALENVLKNAVEYLEKGTKLICNKHDAIEVHKVLDLIEY